MAYGGDNFGHIHFEGTGNTDERLEYLKMTLEPVTERDYQLEHWESILDEN